MATFLQLCKDLAQEAGFSGSGPSSVLNQTGTNKKVVNWIARAYREVQNSRDEWSWLWGEDIITLSTSSSVYGPEFLDSHQRWITDSFFLSVNGRPKKMHYIEHESFKTKFNFISSPGVPEFFTILPNKSIKLNCTPDEAYQLSVEFYRQPFVMANNTDTPAFPEQFHDILMYKGLMYYAADEEAANIYADAKAHYSMLYDRLFNAEHVHEITMPDALA